ncbi:TetR/AcrR family transcriptional regulator [Salinibacterium sp. ZJ70]|uniref:TetR/AcrR family transcriptional regulator n=1 Tax=Salinibacterium sp. ZJ70 TaxID=2708084 RepID=UPI00141DEE5C|nr:TetR/AcrR family transcriptional regulator [Salinibacterium sp. ZJ70]
MSPKTERTEHGSERRAQLLAIAAKLIAERGYTATTVRDIADEAGILSGSLYHHFASKEEILEEVLRSFMDPLLERFEEIASSGDSPRVILDRLIEHSFETIEQKPAAVGLYQNESAFLLRQPGFEFVGEKSRRIEEIWLAVIQDGQRQGVFRDTIDAGIAYRFIRDAVWSTVRWFKPGGRHTAQSLSAHYLDLLHGGLVSS